MTTATKILCPTDFGDASEKAVRAATALAGVFCIEPILTLVIDPVRFAVSCLEASGLGAIACAPVLRDAIHAATSAVRRAAAEARATGLMSRKRVELGSPVTRILSTTRSGGSDLILVGSRCRS